jgi:hypothetical protein
MGYGYVYDTGDSVFGSPNTLAQLVTFDTPEGTLSQALDTPRGVTLKYTDKLYYLPLPGNQGKDEYTSAPKLTYKWRSKKFVLASRTTMAAAKVMKDCGTLTFKLYVDCVLVHTEEVCDCNAFTLPPNTDGFMYEIELIGDAPVHSVKIASSFKELTDGQ